MLGFCLSSDSLSCSTLQRSPALFTRTTHCEFSVLSYASLWLLQKLGIHSSCLLLSVVPTNPEPQAKPQVITKRKGNNGGG